MGQKELSVFDTQMAHGQKKVVCARPEKLRLDIQYFMILFHYFNKKNEFSCWKCWLSQMK